ncbi:hypothetical protein E0F26_05745 [Candidatus Paraluminiphilus aquimaris]|uniref:Cell division protein FtsQ n=1 Tax=Candidatus Paraluminiphilus aquimaris TaxID=2518994 RepID=A0ABY6Q792_9GAMM|nr:hypothetical protein [Candidatus Paraluminiphilus aquimaris]UZP74278.1 hypothetical protein E0F26_05745 [Candidatus Paraluminiphilus aquimaris]
MTKNKELRLSLSKPSRDFGADRVLMPREEGRVLSSGSAKSTAVTRGGQRGMIVTLTVALLLSIGLFLLLGPFEMARATWLLSQG